MYKKRSISPLVSPCIPVRSKSKLNPAIKKSIIPRSGLIDALALPSPIAPSTVPLNATNTPPSSVSKEIKKSQLKDRMLSAIAQPVARPDSNPVHHRSDSAPNLPTGKADKFRPEVSVPTVRPDNGAKLDVTKHRSRPDPTCSAARTEIHHITKDSSKSSFRHSESSHSTNHSRVTDANQTNNLKSEHSNDHVKPRSEGATSKANPVQVRSDMGTVKSEIPQSRPNKVDSIKPRHDSNSVLRGTESIKQSKSDSATSSEVKSNSVLRGPESSKQSRWDNAASSEVKNRFDHGQPVTKVESAQNKVDVIPSDGNSANSSKLAKIIKPTATVGPSLANALASFVDSGLRWTDSIPGVLDLSDDQQQPRLTSKAAEPPTRVDSHFVKDIVSKSEETEDQESLLQRDLAMVLEEISQITRLVEGKDLTQPPQMTKSSDSRTKSVIKTTGSLSTSHSPALAPSSTSNPASRSSITSGTALPPKLTAATRTPPPPAIVSTPVSRISSSPTGANSSVNLISPTHSSRTMSPVSSDHLKSGEKV